MRFVIEMTEKEREALRILAHNARGSSTAVTRALLRMAARGEINLDKIAKEVANIADFKLPTEKAEAPEKAKKRSIFL